MCRLLVVALAVSGTAGAANAHGFGERYDLPLPLSLYLYGTAAIVAVTFVVVALFVRRPTKPRQHARPGLIGRPIGAIFRHPALPFAVKLVSLVLFAVTIAAGLAGDQSPYRNIAPTMVWIIVWVGFVYVSALVGDLWAVANPWRTTFEWAEWLWRRFGGGRGLSFDVRCPDWLGVWPAVALLLVFVWIELIYPTPAVPAQLACFAIGYSVLTWSGMALFGRDIWLQRGEVFSVIFGTYARFAPVEWRTPQQPDVIVRPFGAGLLEGRLASPSMTAFVLLLLATVLYDGLLSTPQWVNLENVIGVFLREPSDYEKIATRSLGLVGFWLLFLGTYYLICVLMSAATAGRPSTDEIAKRFVFTLVPIAIGYHLAHYLVFLLVQGQYIIPLFSDPFGWGWDLFGTAGYRVDIGIVGARFAWYAAVTAIVLGHVFAVYLAHAIALEVVEPRGAALLSQVPLTALMVIYTFVSLSILAEPIVEHREPAQPAATAVTGIAIPADAVLPASGTGALQAVGSGRLAKAKTTYRVLGSNFHDGTRTSTTDLLYAYMFAYRWGARGANDAGYDPYVDAATAALRRHVVGLRAAEVDAVSRSFRIGDVNFLRELFTIDVYTTLVPEDAERDGTIAPPWSTVPWHLIVLMEEAVDRGWAVFSAAEAERRKVEWLDIVRSAQIKERLAALAAEFERNAYRPVALQRLVSAEDARKRWAAILAFYKMRGHFLVTNGPYQLKALSGEGVTLEAFRDLTYPLGVGSYDAYAVPRRGYITAIEQEGSRVRLSGDIETVVKFARSHRVEREAIQSISGDILKRAAPECRYMVIDNRGQVALAGSAGLGNDRAFHVDFDGRLATGRYTMVALIAVNENVMNADIRRIPLQIPSSQ